MLAAFLEEALPVADMAKIEARLRRDPELAGRLALLAAERDSGARFLGRSLAPSATKLPDTRATWQLPARRRRRGRAAIYRSAFEMDRVPPLPRESRRSGPPAERGARSSRRAAAAIFSVERRPLAAEVRHRGGKKSLHRSRGMQNANARGIHEPPLPEGSRGGEQAGLILPQRKNSLGRTSLWFQHRRDRLNWTATRT